MDLLGLLGLPGELRNKIYEMLLLDEEPIDPFSFYVSNTGLFRINKKISQESVPFFYAQNCFDFSTYGSKDIAWFFSRIGQQNTSMIENVYIDCPSLLFLESDVVVLDGDAQEVLTKMCSNCTNLKKLTLSVTSMTTMENTIDSLDNLNTARKALELLDSHLRAFPSIQEINVEVYEHGQCDYIREEMVRLGWTICIKQNVEEYDFDRSFSDFDDWDQRDYDYSSEADSYDIDKDSDFWRRAAD